MKKKDLKKLALMGLTGGLLLGSQCSLRAETSTNTTPNLDNAVAMRNGCGGAGGCGGKPNGNGNGKNGNGNGNNGYGNSQTSYGNSNNKGMMNGNGNGNGKNGNGNNSCGGAGGCGGKPNGNNNRRNNNNNGNMNRRQEISMSGGTVANEKAMSESDLTNALNPQMKAMYQNMSPEGKALALKLANQACKGHNDCKGQNSCKTNENACAGKGSCRGKSECSFKDKNMAVKVAAEKMMQKRQKLHNNN